MIETRLYRPFYILARLAEMLISSASRVLNAAVFGGSTHQTTSARAYIDGQTSEVWAKRRNLIDRMFWFMPNHCASAWAAEVDAARKTLLRAKASE